MTHTGFDDGRVYTEKTDYTKIPKKKFRHPQLEYTIAEIMHSPYLTNPLNKYPKEVFTMSSKLKELKSAGEFIYDANYIVVVFDVVDDDDTDDDDDNDDDW